MDSVLITVHLSVEDYLHCHTSVNVSCLYRILIYFQYSSCCISSLICSPYVNSDIILEQIFSNLNYMCFLKLSCLLAHELCIVLFSLLYLVLSWTAPSWTWRQCDPSKGQELLSQWQCVTSQNTWIFL